MQARVQPINVCVCYTKRNNKSIKKLKVTNGIEICKTKNA